MFLSHLGEYLVKKWGTDLLADASLFVNMTLVRLPEGLVGQGAPQVLDTDASGLPLYSYYHASFVGNILHHQYKIEVKNTVSFLCLFGLFYSSQSFSVKYFKVVCLLLLLLFLLLLFLVSIYFWIFVLDPGESCVGETVCAGCSPRVQRDERSSPSR